MADPPPTPDRVNIICADGVRLQGHFFRHAGSTGKIPVLLCPATGVKQQFYFRFVEWLAQQGHDALVFDYRGIGMSLHGPLKHCKATLAEWGQQDQVAAIDWLLKQTGNQQIALIGHSAGGQMIGLLPNHHRVAKLVGISVSTGWFKGMKPAFRFKARLGLRLLVPLGTLIKGYAPTSAVGLGENLPARVGRDWGRWCAAGGYATNAVRKKTSQDFHHDVRCPITVLHASDDDIATPATVADLMRTFPSSTKKIMRLVPKELGLKSIGHIDWFRSSHQTLWPLIAAELEPSSPAPGAALVEP